MYQPGPPEARNISQTEAGGAGEPLFFFGGLCVGPEKIHTHTTSKFPGHFPQIVHDWKNECFFW